MKAGFYNNIEEMIDIDGDDVGEVAADFAEEHHQIDEGSDMKFDVYVMDDSGSVYKVSMETEFNPSYYVDEINLV